MAVFVFSHVGHDIVEKNPFHVILQSVWGVSFKSDRLFEDSSAHGIETCHLVVASVRHHWVVA